MSEPEISRRCPECGASIRVRTFFCPQCGKTFAKEAAKGAAASNNAAQQTEDSQPEISPAGAEKKAAGSVGSDSLRVNSAGAETGDRPRAGVHRATAAAREALEDNLLPRVEKLRKASSVVMDEAGYDPSLRFVLVAVVLFVLFLVLLWLSKWLG